MGEAAMAQDDYLSMSDEEVMKKGPPLDPDAPNESKGLESTSGEEPSEGAAAGGDEAGEESEVLSSPDTSEEEETSETKDEETDSEESDDTEEEDSEESTEDTDEAAETESGEADTEEKASDDSDDSQIDFEAEYKRVLAPFRANGRDIQVSNVDEAIRLMQMGANYNKKMAGLKPNLKLLKTLEQHELLDEEKLGFLIDVHKRNPQAIAKLLKDSDIDPVDLDVEEKSAEYKPNTYTVSDSEVELDQVVADIRETPTFSKTLEVVGSQWDGASKQKVAQQPNLLRLINDHMEHKVYDVVSARVEKDRMFGQLDGLSDVDAYLQTGQQMLDSGELNHLLPGQGQGSKSTPAKKPAPTAQRKPVDSKVKSQKRAASPTKSAAPAKKVSDDFNPLALSDEEFKKEFLDNHRLL